MIYILIEAFVLSLAISIDTFVAGFGYGLSNIKVPLRSAVFIVFINTIILGISVLLGHLLGGIISTDFAKWFSFGLLLAIGIFKFFSELFKLWLNKKVDKHLDIKMFHFHLILNVMADSNSADIDKNKILTVPEAVSIALVLSIDQIGVGLSHGVSNLYPYILVIFNIFSCFCASLLGTKLGKKISSHIKINLSWLSGLILIILAVVKLFIS